MAQVRSLETGRKFKDTPIGKIPVDWEVIELGEVSEIITKGTTPTTYGHNYIDKGIPFLRVENITENGYINLKDIKYIKSETHEFLSRSKLKEGDILFSIAGALGRCALVTSNMLPANINQTIALVRLKNRNLMNLKFILQMLLSKNIKNQISFEATSLAQTNLNLEQVKNLKIPLPPLPEQKKIAEILSTVDDAIEETDRIIEKTKELKKGMMQKLLTRGIGHKKFKKTEIGEIPVEWKVSQISDYGEIVTGSTPDTSVKEFYGDDYPFVTPFDLGKNKIIMSSEKNLSKKGSLVARLLPINAILFVCIGSTIGKTGVAGKQLATNQQINSVICKENDYNFVFYYLTFISSKIKKLAGTQAVPIINKSLFSSVPITIPKIDEQKKIACVLSSVDSEIENEETKKQELESLKKSLMQVLLTGKVRVK